MSPEKPFFSVLMPVFNAACYLPLGLRDLQRQTWQDFEIIAVDDGSTDGSKEILRACRDPRLRVVERERNGGLVAALNEGLQAARGKWVARQDADDRCVPRRLEAQARALQGQSGVVLGYSRARLLNERGWWRGSLRPPLRDAELRWDLGFRNPVPHTSAVFPLALVRDELGGYDGDNVTADFQLWSRLLERGSALGVAEPLVGYRVHGHSIMGRANAGKAGAGGGEERTRGSLGEILQKNLQRWAGASELEAELLAQAWLAPGEVADWEEYFQIRERLAQARGISPELLAEQDYTLWHRCLAAGEATAQVFWWARERHVPSARKFWPWGRWSLTQIFRLLGRA